MQSRYRPDATSDYSHRFHAGNVGDVWKHVALVEVLRRTAATRRPLEYLDTHAGEGRYPLAATGEWSEGIGRLWTAGPPGDDAAARYVALCRRLAGGGERPASYPGSPAFARALLGSEASLRLWERDETAAARLAAAMAGEGRTRVECGDGLAALGDAVRDAATRGAAVVALVDPPWVEKADWQRVPDALARATAASADACLLLWYPVKSLTRPHAMVARLAAAGVTGTIAELVTTPLAHQRRRLNGSGVLLVRPPDGTLAALAAAAPGIGARCATVAGVWSLRVSAFAPGQER